MFAKEVLLLCCLLVLPAVVFGVDCRTRPCLRTLFNSRVTRADYYSRQLLGSFGSSGKRKRSLSRLHHGIVVTLANSVLGQDRWLIHRGSWSTGTNPDTVITDADYMSSEWVRDRRPKYLSCFKTVNGFLRAGGIADNYNLFTHNCIHAARAMWNFASC
ncbi:uncharacterized protein LOC110460810 [Mizuhopecten yessoensis]|uniref:uncharacterized protein LOC110460810 n=1 Tax=Mizuhopecten yessoensis TaxID=6573 RepID=UPI000B45F5C4|nr:uncharacterized protein LOC110460810 [Mizuhopecten yessoensis]